MHFETPRSSNKSLKTRIDTSFSGQIEQGAPSS